MYRDCMRAVIELRSRALLWRIRKRKRAEITASERKFLHINCVKIKCMRKMRAQLLLLRAKCFAVCVYRWRFLESVNVSRTHGATAAREFPSERWIKCRIVV